MNVTRVHENALHQKLQKTARPPEALAVRSRNRLEITKANFASQPKLNEDNYNFEQGSLV